MIKSIEQWVGFLQGSEALLGLPLLLGGLLFMLGGWRLWKLAVVLTFAVIGGVVGVKLAKTPSTEVIYCIVGALALGAASFPPANYSLAVLGGLIGAAIVHAVLVTMWLQGPALWILVALTLGVVAALAYVHLRQVIVIITSFEGAVLIVSGLVAILADHPQIYHFFRTIARNYWFFLPFLLTVPTVVGCMLQMADARKHDAGMATG